MKLKKIKSQLEILLMISTLSFSVINFIQDQSKLPLRNEERTVIYIFAENDTYENMCILQRNDGGKS
jgi:hypothetical protein